MHLMWIELHFDQIKEMLMRTLVLNHLTNQGTFKEEDNDDEEDSPIC